MRLEATTATTATAAGPEHSTGAAIAKGYFKQVRFLLELGHPPNTRLADGRTPLILCALVKDSSWRSGLARTLLEKGARVGLADRAGLNALHYAAMYECADLVPILLRAADFDLNQSDKFGNTPLFYAANTGNADIVAALVTALRRYHLPLDRANREGLTPLMQAWRRDHHRCARLLADAGASGDSQDAFGKACREYERESVARVDARRAVAEQKQQRSRIRYDDVDAWRRHQERSRSAPPAHQQLQQLTGAGPWREEERERRRQNAMAQRDEGLAISEASPFDSRNDPEAVFQASAAEFFGRYQRARKITVQARSGRPQRPKTAHHATHRRGRHPGAAAPGGEGASWKRGVPGLYRHFEVQCSCSYRRTVKPPQGLEGDSHATLGSIGGSGQGGAKGVGNSPVVSDAASEVTDRSRGSRKSGSVSGVRGGAAKSSKAGVGPGSGASGRSRKISATTRLQSMESLIEDEAAGGADSVTVRGLRMRAKPSSAAGLPPRPVSRASYTSMPREPLSP